MDIKNLPNDPNELFKQVNDYLEAVTYKCKELDDKTFLYAFMINMHDEESLEVRSSIYCRQDILASLLTTQFEKSPIDFMLHFDTLIQFMATLSPENLRGLVSMNPQAFIKLGLIMNKIKSALQEEVLNGTSPNQSRRDN